ncbi:BA75_04658T0 [Komagataella pastoris]|uniref:BA75_04658T0 n=1 Tax=Komagataella pastoris TaxID=4922 RepID=A0A1B2JJ65_PICPA|nr:BA75_04658T0 [Komagataella pastoris]
MFMHISLYHYGNKISPVALAFPAAIGTIAYANRLNLFSKRSPEIIVPMFAVPLGACRGLSLPSRIIISTPSSSIRHCGNVLETQVVINHHLSVTGFAVISASND